MLSKMNIREAKAHYGTFERMMEDYNQLEYYGHMQVNRYSSRAFVDVLNQRFMIDTVVPHNIFKPSYDVVYTDVVLQDTPENKALVEKYKGTLSDACYTEENVGLAVFKDESDALFFLWDTEIMEKLKEEFKQSIL